MLKCLHRLNPIQTNLMLDGQDRFKQRTRNRVRDLHLNGRKGIHRIKVTIFFSICGIHGTFRVLLQKKRADYWKERGWSHRKMALWSSTEGPLPQEEEISHVPSGSKRIYFARITFYCTLERPWTRQTGNAALGISILARMPCRLWRSE